MARIELLEQLLVEGEQNDNEVLGILRQGGVGEDLTVEVLELPLGLDDRQRAKELKKAKNNLRREILEQIKAMPIGNEENAPVLGRFQNGKNMLPVARWYVGMYRKDNNPLHGIGDAVRQIYGLNTTKQNAIDNGLVVYYDQFNNLKDLLRWLGREAERPENVVKTVKKRGAYDFPDLEVYSDPNVDVYKADTPAEAIELGNGYSFCISSRGGGNQFYTYRFGTHPSWGAKQKTSCYFVWFKDKDGNKTWKDMIVVHVGENGNYLVTPARNGLFPWRSRSYVLEHYPKLEPALPHMVYKKPTAIEEFGTKFNSTSEMTYEPVRANKKRENIDYLNVVRYDPKDLEIIISQGVELDNNAFRYIFDEIDGKDLVNGNHGNSLIKKYIEIGGHELTTPQKEMLTEAGYGKEVARALLVSARNKLNRCFQDRYISDQYKLSDAELLTAIANATDDELNGKPEDTALVYYLTHRRFTLSNEKIADLLLERGHPELAFASVKEELEYVERINSETKLDDRVEPPYLDTYEELLPNLTPIDWMYIFWGKGKLFKARLVVKLYLEAMKQRGKTVPERIMAILAKNGYGNQVSRSNKETLDSELSRWLEGEGKRKGWKLQQWENGYMLISDSYYDYIDIPFTRKPIKRIALTKGARDKFRITFTNIVGKELPLIVDENGNTLKLSSLSLYLPDDVTSLVPYKMSFENLKDTNSTFYLYSKGIHDLKGLPPIGDRVLGLDCRNSSLEGLKGEGCSLGVRMIASLKGMPKKLANLEMRYQAYFGASDRQMPDEVTGFCDIEAYDNETLDILPKKVGSLRFTNQYHLPKIKAKDCEISELPTLKYMKGNVKWFQARSNEGVLRKTAEEQITEELTPYRFLGDGCIWYGKGAKSQIPDEEVLHVEDSYWNWRSYHQGTPICVHPCVTSLEGLKVPTKVTWEEGKEGEKRIKERENPCQLVVFDSRMTSLKGLPSKGFRSVFLYNCPYMEDVRDIMNITEEDFTFFVGANCKRLSVDMLKELHTQGVDIRRVRKADFWKGRPEIGRDELYFWESLQRLGIVLNGFGIYG